MVQEKNESVFVCPLGQDSQKNLANTIEQINCDLKALPTITQQNSLPILEKSLENEGMRAEPSEANDLELLLKDKASLEEESRRLDVEEKRLDLLVRIHIDEFAKETKKRNSEKKHAIIQLREQIGRLEAQLGLEESVEEPKMMNDEKQKANDDLLARICTSETQVKEFAVCELSVESIPEKVDICQYTPSSKASQEELLDSGQNGIAVEIIEEIK